MCEVWVININESLAECIDRGYLNNAAYNVLLNKTIYIYTITIPCVISSENTPNEEIEKAFDSISNKSFTLTKSGEEFLNL